MNDFKVDILAIGAHPDDVELGAGGTIISHVKKGYKAAIVDLTEGELGTRGTVKERLAEATEAAKIMGVSFRENLGLRDGFFFEDEPTLLKVVAAIRKYKPKFILANALYDRHPDHCLAADLIERASFLSGLIKVVTLDENATPQQPWRPTKVFHYIQSIDMVPTFTVDVSESFDQKMEAVLAYKSQFYNPESKEPATYISSPIFLENVKARAINFGYPIGCRYAEGFLVKQPIGLSDIFSLS